jgi:tRNA A-37 threonylcarbamoyl transferase component Bud32
MAAGGDDETVTAEGERRIEPAAPPSGTAGPYRLVELLGAGGMGTVWRARDEVLLREVAVKRLPPERAGHAEARARMLREARAQAALNHPNICTIHQAGDDDDGVWIAMELLAGPSLDVKLRAAPVAAVQVAAWGADIARALATAHARSLVHRDLKPSNVMLDAAGRVKVTDFGLVKLVAGDAHADAASSPAIETTLTRDGAILGSPRYMSPEQARGDDVGPPSDVFSLGVVLYELASGARAFEGATAMDTIAAILKDEPRPLRNVAPSVPPALAALVHRCLARDPAARPTATELADALAAPMRAPRRSRRGLAIALGVAAIAAGAIALYVASRGSEPDATPAAVPATAPPASTVAAAPSALAHEVTLLGEEAIHEAAFDPSGRYVFFLDNAGHLWRSVDDATPSPVSGVGPVTDVTCCWHGRVVVFTEAGAVSVSPGTLDAAPIPGLVRKGPGFEAAFSEDGRRYALTSADGVVIGDTDGVAPPRTLATQGPAFTLRWSPDGRWLALTLFADSSNTLVLVDADRSTLHAARIREMWQTGTGEQPHGIAWVGPDRLIVLGVRGSHHTPIWTWLDVGRDGAVTELGVSDLAGRPLQPLSSNGHRIVAFESRLERQICIADFDGTRMGKLEPQPGPVGELGDWRRDHRFVVSVADPPTHSVGLGMFAPGGSPTPLLPADPGVVLGNVSIVDHAMYFMRASEHAATSLWVADDDGTHARQLASIPDAFVLSCGTGVCAVSFAHGEKHDVRLFDPVTSSLGPVLHQAGDYYGEAAVSPDGRYVAIGENRSVWIYDRKLGTSTVREARGLAWVQSIAFAGDDLILTDPSFAPGNPALLRLKPTGDVEVLAADADWYHAPKIDPVAHRLVVLRHKIHRSLVELDLPPPPPR